MAVLEHRTTAWLQVSCAEQWLTVGENQLIPIGRVPSIAQLGRCLQLRKRATVNSKQGDNLAAAESETQAAETQQRDVFGRSAGVGAECGWYRRWRTRNVCSRTSRAGREASAGIHNLHRRSGALNRLARAVRGDDGGARIHWSVLDSTVRDS